MKCPECGGSDLQGTCVCGYDYLPEQRVQEREGGCDDIDPDTLLCAGRLLYENVESPEDAKQICHFCGVDLFLYKANSKILTCRSCATQLDHDDCTECVRCNQTWLVDGSGSVCALCRIL